MSWVFNFVVIVITIACQVVLVLCLSGRSFEVIGIPPHVTAEPLQDAAISVHKGSRLSPTCVHVTLLLLDPLEFECSIFDCKLLVMRLFVDLPRLDGISGEEVSDYVVLDANIRCVFHSLEVLEAARLHEVKVLLRVL